MEKLGRNIKLSIFSEMTCVDLDFFISRESSELRGAANPNQARYHCPFAVQIRRSSMPGHREYRMERLGRNIKLSIFSEMTV